MACDLKLFQFSHNKIALTCQMSFNLLLRQKLIKSFGPTKHINSTLKSLDFPANLFKLQLFWFIMLLIKLEIVNAKSGNTSLSRAFKLYCLDLYLVVSFIKLIVVVILKLLLVLV